MGRYQPRKSTPSGVSLGVSDAARTAQHWGKGLEVAGDRERTAKPKFPQKVSPQRTRGGGMREDRSPAVRME